LLEVEEELSCGLGLRYTLYPQKEEVKWGSLTGGFAIPETNFSLNKRAKTVD